MCPELLAEEDWNLVTKGDICESILGADFVWRFAVSAWYPELKEPFGRHLADVASLVNAFVWVVYRLLAKVNNKDSQDLLSWIVNMARRRVDQALVQFVAVDREVNLKIFEVWPREKLGRLRQAV